jgi:hypothetical protein
MHCSTTRPWCEIVSSGRRFVLQRTPRDDRKKGAEDFRIKELPRGAPLPDAGDGTTESGPEGSNGTLQFRDDRKRARTHARTHARRLRVVRHHAAKLSVGVA